METTPIKFSPYPDNQLTLSMLHYIVEMQVSDPDVYHQFVGEMKAFGDEIREKHGEYSKSVPFQLETAKRYVDDVTRPILVAYRIVFTLPADQKEAWWCFFNEDREIDRIEHQTGDYVPNYRH